MVLGSAVSGGSEAVTGGTEARSVGHRGIEERDEGATAVTFHMEVAAVGAAAEAVGSAGGGRGGTAVVRVGRLGKARRRRQRMAQVMSIVNGGGASAEGLANAQRGGIEQSAAECNMEASGRVSATACEGAHEKSEFNQNIVEPHPSDNHTRLADGGDVAAKSQLPAQNEAVANDMSRMDTQMHSFHRYCQQALQRMNDPSEVPFSEAAAVWREVQPHVHAIAAVWVLRAVLAGPLEALIIVDRLLMMEESGGTFKPGGVVISRVEGRSEKKRQELFEFDVVPLFDPVLSPRNMVILANKC